MATVLPKCNLDCPPTGLVEFYVGKVKVGIVDHLEADGSATLIDAPLCGDFGPELGLFDVSATFVPDNRDIPDGCNLYLGSSGVCEDCLTITCENDIEVTYTSQTVIPTAIGSPNANIVLSAFVEEKDLSNCGFTNAKVVFVVDGTRYEAPVGLIDPNNPAIGAASIPIMVTLKAAGEDYTLVVTVEGYYCGRSEDVENIHVYTPQNDFITGGGYLILEKPNGIWAGKPSTKNNFGFNVKYNKSGKSLQGNINVIYRREVDGVMRTFQVKGNAMTSLTATIGKFPTPSKATFLGKANIQDITELPYGPAYPMEGNATLCVEMEDWGEPRKSDKIGITVWNKAGGIFFASRWEGGPKTIQQVLGGGNLVVHSLLKSGSIFIEKENFIESTGSETALQVYPNPASGPVTLRFITADSGPTTIEIISATGQVVQRAWDGYVKAGEYQTVEMENKLAKGLYFIQLRSGSEIRTVRLVVSSTF